MKEAPPPRFVPILTEVVTASTPEAGGVPAPVPPSDPPALTEDELARRVLARVLTELEPIVLDAVRSVQTQQARSLEVLVRTELALHVARLVDGALRQPPSSD